MDPLFILLIIVIILAGGVIGMVADHLGRKIGKKKLSFRTMRPKHVARLGTFIAGVLISSFTIFVVFFTSSDIRQVIREGRGAIKKSQELTRTNMGLEDAIRQETEKISRLDGEAKTARTNLEQARANLASIHTQLATANQNLAEARKRIEFGKVALAKNESLLKKNQQLLASKQSQLASVGSKLAAAQTNYAALQKNYKTVDALRVQANEEVTNLREQRNTLTGAVDRLRADKVQLTTDRETARAELATARADLHQGVLELDQVRASLEDARQNLKQAQIDAASYKFAASSSRAEPMIYQKGQEVQRLQLPAHLSARQAQQAWEKLMSSTSRAASEHGADPQPGTTSCVFLPPWRPSGAGSLEASPLEQQQAILARITGQDQEIVLIAQALVNTFKGEPVPLTLIGLPNPIVYHKGEILAELHVGKHWLGSQALVEFNDFMQQKVQDKIKSKMIPIAGQPNSLIEIAPAKTLELVEELSRAPRDSILQVSSHAETRAADSLQLDFRFK